MCGADQARAPCASVRRDQRPHPNDLLRSRCPHMMVTPSFSACAVGVFFICLASPSVASPTTGAHDLAIDRFVCATFHSPYRLPLLLDAADRCRASAGGRDPALHPPRTERSTMATPRRQAEGQAGGETHERAGGHEVEQAAPPNHRARTFVRSLARAIAAFLRRRRDQRAPTFESARQGCGTTTTGRASSPRPLDRGPRPRMRRRGGS